MFNTSGLFMDHIKANVGFGENGDVDLAGMLQKMDEDDDGAITIDEFIRVTTPSRNRRWSGRGSMTVGVSGP